MSARKKATKKKATRKRSTKKKSGKKSVRGEKSPGDERDQAIGKLKNLLTEHDYDVIDLGIELARSLDDPTVFEEMLDGCSIGEGGGLVRNEFFSSSNDAQTVYDEQSDQSYLDYALLELIANVPGSARLHRSIEIDRVTKLSPQAFDWKQLPPSLARFSKLASFHVDGWRSLENVDVLAGCTQLTELGLVGFLMTTAENMTARRSRVWTPSTSAPN